MRDHARRREERFNDVRVAAHPNVHLSSRCRATLDTRVMKFGRAYSASALHTMSSSLMAANRTDEA